MKDGKQEEEFMRREWFIAMILLIFFVTGCGRKEEGIEEKPTPIRGLKIETIRLAPVEEEYEAVGTVRSRTTSVLSSKTVGNILAVHVREGDRVRTDQLLIEIDDRDSRTQLQKAQAGLREVEDAKEEIEQNILAAKSAREAAEAGKSLARVTFKRYQALLEQKSVSQQEYDEVQAKLKVAEAEADRAATMIQALMAKKGQVLAKMEQVKAGIAGAEINVGYSRILSPINGIVTAKQAEIGLLATPGVPLLTVEDNSHYRLEVSVEDAMLNRIHLRDPVRISIDALGQEEFSRKVSEIVPASDPASRSYTVKVDLPEGPKRSGTEVGLKSGLFGKARFPVGKTEAILIPQSAIVHEGQLTGVYVVDQAGIARFRLVKTGKIYEGRIEILSGLNQGDRIASTHVEVIKDGDRVEEGS
jgi:multidrug efflux system membrane fusion protein